MSFSISWSSIYFDVPVKGVGYFEPNGKDVPLFFKLIPGEGYHIYEVSVEDMESLNKERLELEKSTGFTIYHDGRYSAQRPENVTSELIKKTSLTPDPVGPTRTIKFEDIVNPIPHLYVNENRQD